MPVPITPPPGRAPEQPSTELQALRALRDRIQALYDAGGHITRAKVADALTTYRAAVDSGATP